MRQAEGGVASSVPSEEIERTIVWIFVATRIGQLAFSALMVAGDLRRYRRPRMQVALLVAVTAESVWRCAPPACGPSW